MRRRRSAAQPRGAQRRRHGVACRKGHSRVRHFGTTFSFPDKRTKRAPASGRGDARDAGTKPRTRDTRAARSETRPIHHEFVRESISDKQRASARPAPPWWHASRSSGTASIIIYIADRVRTLGAVRERIAFTANSCAREARWRVKRANIEIGVLAGFAHRHTFVACSLRIATLQSYTNHDAIVF